MSKYIYCVGFTKSELRHLIKLLKADLDECYLLKDTRWYKKQQKTIEMLKNML